MADTLPHSPVQRPSRWRRIFWMLASAIVVFLVGKAVLSEIPSVGADQIALVRIEGPILDSQQIVNDLKTFGENPMVRAVVIRIDSPGGGVAPSQEIYSAVKRLRDEKNKTVVASMGNVAASGGYYIAVATDRIIANPGSLTGSIGVIMQLPNFEEVLEKIGVKNITIKSGRYKDMGSPFRPMSDEDRQLFQSLMDDAHRQFIEAVAEGRSLDIADVELLADGRVFTGQQAKDMLLVDELGDLHAAVKIAAEMSGIQEPHRLVEPSRSFSFREFMQSQFWGNHSLFPTSSGIHLMYLMAF